MKVSKLFGIALAGIVGMALVGCSGGDPEESADVKPGAESQKNLKVDGGVEKGTPNVSSE
jgi:hypothetical protein